MILNKNVIDKKIIKYQAQTDEIIDYAHVSEQQACDSRTTIFQNSIRATQNIVSNHTCQDDGHIRTFMIQD